MTSIDQAFIRAYLGQEECPATVAPELAEPGRPADLSPDPVPEEAAAVPDDPPADVLEPSFQVDSFAWPSGCTRLGMVAGDQLDRLADALETGLEQGQQVVAMSGCRRGDGCTTLAPDPVPEEAAALPDDPPADVLEPSFQVDSFAWPSGCTRLGMVAGDQLDRLADALETGLEQGQQVVAMSGCRRGDGCTTLLLCAARRLAERGLKVAVVDADFDNPLLARRLGLLPEAGWEEMLAARLPVEQVIIESVQDRLAVLPLCGSLPCQGRPAQHAPDPAMSLDRLREHYDLVLVDWGELGDGAASGNGPSHAVVDWIDAVVLVHNVGSTPREELDRARRRVQAAGLVEAGITENFVEVRKSA